MSSPFNFGAGRRPSASKLPGEVDVMPSRVRGEKGTFGDALRAMMLGRRAQRSGWNGKGMWVAWTPASQLPVGQASVGAAKLLADEHRTGGRTPADTDTLYICGHLDMRAADGSLVVGWLASQTDMLATDWLVLP